VNDELACNGERVPNKGFCWSLEDGLKKEYKRETIRKGKGEEWKKNEKEDNNSGIMVV
jgi:hypothetical protein